MKTCQKILIVDDESRNLRILEEILGDFSILLSASNGAQAIDLVEEHDPDLVLLDVMMPGVSGFEVCRAIKAKEKAVTTRVILVTGKAMIEEKMMGYEAGADDYVTKPYMAEELEAKVRVFLGLVATERKLFETTKELEEQVNLRTEQLLRSEKAAFVGMHTAEIVHNMKNPLAALIGNMHFLAQKYPDEKYVDKSRSAIERLRETINGILESTRQSNDCSVRPVDINEVIRNELKILEADSFLKYEVKVSLQLAELPPIDGQPSHFAQTFGNLLKNAIDAMHGRETRELSVRTSHSDSGLRVEISDTGCGIPRENMQRIFDPFFTTKIPNASGSEPAGTGLGLASVKRMLESYQARIQFHSEQGKGTTVVIELPLRSGNLRLLKAG